MKVCHLLTYPISRNGGTEVAVRNIRQDYDVKSLGIGGPFLYLASFLMAVRLIFSNYDIIHIHDMAGYGYTFVPKFLRKKTVFSCHGLWATYFQGKGSFGSRFLITAQKRLIEKSDLVVATSRFRTKEIKKLYDVDPIYVHNGVDVEKFVPIKTKKEHDFVWVGTNTQKGLNFAIKISRKNRKKLLVVGVRGNNDSLITYEINVPHDSMPQVYNKCRTLINYSNISRYDFVVLEAMACGINVVINKESAEELMPQKKFIHNTVFISGKKGRKIVESLSWDTAIEKYNEIYRRLVV